MLFMKTYILQTYFLDYQIGKRYVTTFQVLFHNEISFFPPFFSKAILHDLRTLPDLASENWRFSLLYNLYVWTCTCSNAY